MVKVGEIVCNREDKKTSANWRIGLNTEHDNYTALLNLLQIFWVWPAKREGGFPSYL